MFDALEKIPRPSDRFRTTLRELSLHEHICLLYRDQEEGLLSACEFVQHGLEQGDQCVYVADDNTSEEVTAMLSMRGVDTERAISSGQLIIVTKQESYLKEGSFDPDTTINFFAAAADDALKANYRGVRGAAEMTWQLGGDPGTERLLEYESKMNDQLFPKHSVLGMCQFNVRRFSPEMLKEILFTHPVVVVGGLVCQNLYYTPPGEYHPRPSINAEYEVKEMIKNIFDLARMRFTSGVA